MKIGFIILSRYNSSRLPGKALRLILGKPVIMYIYERLQKITDRENIVVATSMENTDNPINEFCWQNNIQVFRGSLENVAQRFKDCANYYRFDYAVRVNGDNLFADNKLLKEMCQLAKYNKYEFIENVMQKTYPKGMSIEIVKTSYYNMCFNLFNEPNHYEHVTLYLYQNYGRNNFSFKEENHKNIRDKINLALDTKEDMDRIEKIMRIMKKENLESTLENIIYAYNKVIG